MGIARAVKDVVVITCARHLFRARRTQVLMRHSGQWHHGEEHLLVMRVEDGLSTHRLKDHELACGIVARRSLHLRKAVSNKPAQYLRLDTRPEIFTEALP